MAKRQAKTPRGKVEVTFQDETANFKLPSTLVPNTNPKVASANLAFVNLTGSSGPTQDAGKRRLVRAHVMREFQREKKESEQIEFERWKEQNQRELRVLESYVQQVPHPDAAEVKQWSEVEVEEMQIEDDDENLLWGVTLHHQSGAETDVFSHGVGTWTTGFISPEDDDAMENVAFEFNDAESTFNLPLTTMPNQIFDIPLLAVYENRMLSEDIVSEDIDCPLISNSIKGITRDSVSFSRMDPFDSMPGLSNARAQAIMYHYNKVLMPTLISVVDPESKWFNYAITDPALFHGTMLHSAAHNALLSGNTALADPTPIKWETTRLINQRLDDPALSVSDVTMGAVVCLVLFENQSGNLELSNIHMNGLRRMINLRGGIQNLGLSGVLKRKILWADVCNATLMHTQPRFNLSSSSPSPRPNHPSNSPFTSPTLSPTLGSNSSASHSSQLSEILTSLRSLSHTVATNRQPKLLISDDIYIVERQIVSLLATYHSSRHSSKNPPIPEPCLLAAFIYIYIFLRDFPLRAPIFIHLVERLASSLFDGRQAEDILAKDAWDEQSEMYLWVLTLGALVSEERSEREKFVIQLRMVCDLLGIGAFGEFEGVLKGVAWLKGSSDESAVRSGPFLRILWDESKFLGILNLEDVGMDGTMDLTGGF